MRESRIEEELKKAVAKMGGMCMKFVSPELKGVPDQIVLLPGRHGKKGYLVFVETKQKGKRPSIHQRDIHKKLRRYGQTVIVVDSVEQLKNIWRTNDEI